MSTRPVPLDLRELNCYDFSECRCKVHVKPHSKGATVGCGVLKPGTHPTILGAYTGASRACGADLSTRLMDKAALELLCTGRRFTAYESFGVLPQFARFQSANGASVEQFGAGYCFMDAIRPRFRWRAARLLGPDCRVDCFKSVFSIFGLKEFRQRTLVRVGENRYHLVVTDRKGVAADAGVLLEAEMSRLLRDHPDARIGASGPHGSVDRVTANVLGFSFVSDSEIASQFIEEDESISEVSSGASLGSRVSEREAARRARKKWTSESLNRKAMFDEMRGYLPQVASGEDVRDIRKPGNIPLTYDERSTLLRLLPNTRARQSGRHEVIHKDGTVTETTYDCKFNLAGRLYLASLDGMMTPVELPSSGDDCGHMSCATRPFIRSGGVSDAIVVVLPKRISEMPLGLMSADGAGASSMWRKTYKDAVLGLSLAKATLTRAKFRALLGHKYLPPSKFCEVVVFMTKMFGMQEVSFYNYSSHSETFSMLLAGVPGSSREFEDLMDSTHAAKSVRLTNYAWGLHHLCRLQAVAPNHKIPFRSFLLDIDKMSRRNTKALQLLVALHAEDSGVIRFEDLSIDVDDTVGEAFLDAKVEAVDQNLRVEEIRRNRSLADPSDDHPLLSTHAAYTIAYEHRSRVRLIRELMFGDSAAAFAGSGLCPSMLWFDRGVVCNAIRYDRGLSDAFDGTTAYFVKAFDNG